MMTKLLGAETATFKRYGAMTRDPDTGRTAGGAPVSTEFTGSFQPLSGREREALPEGVRSSESLKVYTNEPLRTADQHDGVLADVVTYNGRDYRVVAVDRWPVMLDHFKVTLQRTQEGA